MGLTDLGVAARSGRGHAGRPGLASRPSVRAQAVDLAFWCAAAGLGLLLAALVANAGLDLATTPNGAAEAASALTGPAAEDTGAPFRLAWREPHLAPSVLLPVAVAVVTLVLARRSTSVRWPVLLLLGFAGSLAWSVALGTVAGPGLADGLQPPRAYLVAADSVGDDPLGYLARWTDPPGDGATATGTGDPVPPAAMSAALVAHPPGPVLLVWGLGRLGLGGGATGDSGVLLGLVLTALTAAGVPLVAIAVRSLCHETAARRAVPVLVLTPWALWAAASPRAVTLLPAAAALAVGVVGCEAGRRGRPLWALSSGLLLGVTSLFDYAAVWLGVGVAAAYFVRRRPLMNVFTGVGALIPFWLFFLGGFSWPDGLAAARAEAGVGVMLTWLALNAVVVLLAGGPITVRALRRIRMTPGWPFLVGAGTAALFGLCAGLCWGGVEQTWLPLAPWLAVAALAPRPRPDGPGDTVRAGDLPGLLIGTGSLAAIVLRVFLGNG